MAQLLGLEDLEPIGVRRRLFEPHSRRGERCGWCFSCPDHGDRDPCQVFADHDREDPEILGLKAILAPPTATPIQIQDVDRSQELQWIAANRKAYRGRWVAVQGSKLVADAASFRDLQRRVKKLEGEPPPLVHHME